MIPRLSYYMQRVLVRLAREAQRLAGKVIIIIIVIILIIIIIVIIIIIMITLLADSLTPPC